MPKTKSGVSQVGGKFRLCNTILKYIPYHEFFLSLFCGACWVELNKPRSRYECYNDLDSEIINYLVMIERYPKEFDEMKQGVYGLVSQEICNRIVRGELKPRNDLERAYFFYFLNKLTFGGDVKKIGNNDNAHAHQGGIMRPTDPCRQPQVEKIKKEYDAQYCGLITPNVGGSCVRDGALLKDHVEKIKKEYEYKTKGFGGMINPRAGLPTLHKETIEELKDEFKTKGYFGVSKGVNVSGKVIKEVKKEWKTKGYHGLVDQKLQNARIDKPGCEEAKSTYRGIVLPTVCKDKSIDEAKVNYRGIVPKSGVKASFAGINNTRAGNNASNMRDMDKWKKEFDNTLKDGRKRVNYSLQPSGLQVRSRNVDQAKASYKGIANHGATGWGTLESGEVKKAKQQYQAVSYKGINPKTTRPYHNNDCGLLTPLDQKAIKRLRYVNLTCYDFKRVYTLFYKAFHVRKGLSRECFVYADPPYCGTEKYYGSLFPVENHQELINFMLKTPFNFMLSVGGKCEMYLEQLSDWVIVPVKVRYSTDATSQKKSQEYIIMNYEVNDVGNMQIDNQSSLSRFF